MFVSSYNTIEFFVKKFSSSNVYIPVNTIFECLYYFYGLERDHQLSAYAIGGRWGSSKMHAAALSLFMFLAAFLSDSILFYLQKFNLTFIQKRCVRQKRLLVNRGSELVTRGFEFIYCRVKLVIGGFELVARKFEPVTREFELLDLNSHF